MSPRKTAQGQAEIGLRTLGLGPLARRLLILVDGQRDVPELSALMGGRDIAALLDELVAKGCVETAPGPQPVLQDGLPERDPAQLDMGRHFIVNTLSTFTGPYAHADLMAEAMKAAGQAELRALVGAWRAALEVVVPERRLAGLQADLLKVI